MTLILLHSAQSLQASFHSFALDQLRALARQIQRSNYLLSKMGILTAKHKESVIDLFEMISDKFPNSSRGISITPILQLILSLRFYAVGSFHNVTADLFSVSTATVGRCGHRVAKIICRLRSRFIHFSDEQNFLDIKRQFYEIAQFPGK